MKSNWKTRFRSAWWIGSFIALVGMMCQAVCGQSSSPDDTEDTRERLVMLKTGRMLSGQVRRNAGGFLIEQPNGRVQVANDEVAFVVNNLREAYRQQRDSQAFPTAAAHMSLAHWCISHRLYDEARDELKTSLKSDPENEEARRLLQRVSDTMRASLPAATPTPPPPRTVDGFVQPDVESLGGLSRETAMQFTSKIQPLLLNKCGNAACHGATSSNGFRLVAARIGGNGSRQNTERNLAEALKQIDLEDVAASRLLSISTTGHGGKGTIFSGQAGTEQLKLLKTWTSTVVEEKQAQAAELAQRPTIHGRNLKKTTKPPSVTAEVNTAAFTSSEVIEKSNTSTETPALPRQLPDEPADAKPTTELKPLDPFDPDIFNRRFR